MQFKVPRQQLWISINHNFIDSGIKQIIFKLGIGNQQGQILNVNSQTLSRIKYLYDYYRNVHTFPSIHCSMGSVPVGAQCPFTSLLGEFLGYWDWLWYPGLSPVLVSIALPFAFHISVFSIHSSSPAIGFHSSIFHGGSNCTPPPTLLLIPD